MLLPYRFTCTSLLYNNFRHFFGLRPSSFFDDGGPSAQDDLTFDTDFFCVGELTRLESERATSLSKMARGGSNLRYAIPLVCIMALLRPHSSFTFISSCPSMHSSSTQVCRDGRVALWAKKKAKGNVNAAKMAALEALEKLEAAEAGASVAASANAVLDEPDVGEKLSAKEMKKQMKMKKKNNNKPAAAPPPDLFVEEEEAMSAKDKKRMMKAGLKAAKQSSSGGGTSTISVGDLEQAASEAAAAVAAAESEAEEAKVDEVPAANDAAESFSAEDELDFIMGGGKKKEKKEKKDKKEKKEKNKNKKKKKKGAEVDEDPSPVAEDAAPVASSSAANPLDAPVPLTLEDKIRNSRPPPKVRVMEGVQPGFVSLRLEDVVVTFRNQEVLKGVTWDVKSGERVGLVGVNGGGKTTQLKVLDGELEPTAGDVVKSSKDLRVSILRQEFVDELVMTRTLKEEFMSVFDEENLITSKLRESEVELEQCDPTDVDKMQEILDRMQKLQAKADAKDVTSLESRAEKIMDLMGFDSIDATLPVSSFSGGWKMRIGLGKVLLKDPNILLLDEPTNHLDMESVEWLEDFLRNQNIPMVIVSHDREFLDQVCTKIVDTEGGLATTYDGNYSRFLKQKAAKMKAWQSAYETQEKKIKEEKAWIQKFKVKQPQAVKQRIARLEKLQNSESYVQKPPFTGKPFRFRFPPAPRLSDEVAVVSDVVHGYEGNALFDKCDMTIEREDRIALLGPNGSGKSTMLRLVVGKEEPIEGKAGLVGMNVVANYFEQNQADVLDLEKTVSQTVEDASDNHSYNELRALMGQFLFKGDMVEKKVKQLSGGEKARVSDDCADCTWHCD